MRMFTSETTKVDGELIVEFNKDEIISLKKLIKKNYKTSGDLNDDSILELKVKMNMKGPDGINTMEDSSHGRIG